MVVTSRIVVVVVVAAAVVVDVAVTEAVVADGAQNNCCYSDIRVGERLAVARSARTGTGGGYSWVL